MLRWAQGLAWIGPEPGKALAQRYGTPLYVYDREEALEQIGRFRSALHGIAEIYLAAKAQPNRKWLAALRSRLDGVDVASWGEIEAARAGGFSFETLSYAGPAKTRADLLNAIENGILVSVESEAELDMLIDMAKGRSARCMVRINPVEPVHAFAVKMGGVPSPFGIDDETLPRVMSRIQAAREKIRFEGIHVYAGSQCMSALALMRHVSATLRSAEAIEAQHGLACQTINLGGGIGVPYDGRKPFDLDTFGARATEVLTAYRRRHPEVRFIFELGRYLLAEAGLFITRIIRVVTSYGETFVVLDGGLPQHLFATGNLRGRPGHGYPVVNLSREEGPAVRCHLAGPTCTPLDTLGKDVTLIAPQAGDVIGVQLSGAYGYTASPLLFLGHDTPAEIMVDGQAVTCIRERRSVSAWD